MTQIDRARLLAHLHVKGNPLILFNVWDAGSARAVAETGAKAIATGSWSVAAAHGFGDGEELPLNLVLANARRIVGTVDLPVTIDFEGGYGEASDIIAANVKQLIGTGAVGCNFEDGIVGGDGIYCIDHQCARIAAMRRAAEETGVPFFINARTDVFLKAAPAEHRDHLEEAVRRAAAYARAGASGFFAPGLRKPEQIQNLCELSPLPINILALPDAPSTRELAEIGVARISYGPGPYREMIASLKTAAQQAMAPD